jgi:hypothetical protein
MKITTAVSSVAGSGPRDELKKPDFTKAQLARPLRLRDVEPLLAGIAPEIRKFVEAAVTPLQRRIAELEDRPTLSYLGVYEQARQYTRGNFVTHDGSLWHCRADLTRARPGSDSDWQLAAKRGTNGKDARR